MRRPRPDVAPRRRLDVAPAGLALLALGALVALGGCGGVGVSTAGTLPGNHLTVYSSLPFQGPDAGASLEIENGEKLALAHVGGRVGRFDVDYASLDDADPTTGEATPGITASNARVAAQDTSTIAYIGELDSDATAVSLSFINEAGILQVSPSSPYVGLTSSLDAGQDEPDRFYPTGQRTFVRLQPGDPVQAAAQVRLMRTLHLPSVYIIYDLNPFDAPLAAIVAEDAKRAGIKVVGEEQLDTSTTEYVGEVHKVLASGARAVFFSGAPSAGTVALWQQLHTADTHLRLLGSSALAEPSFARQIGAAAAHTYLTTPLLPLSLYPSPAQRVLSEYRRRFHRTAGPYALYGYEAMSAVLLAIHRAGRHGDNREAVLHKFFAIRRRDSVLGTYSVLPDGETTLSHYAVNRVHNGRLVFYRVLSLPAPS
ncbi:MAG TPA: branched-chain amino acid ABC transporter substrate-binding protein [Solirubrobacteraceae bacterium]|nr:branched-chain amino acid ABC transporter substrate-binding protein [Solirubrobacteraceae bacterium]